MRARLVKIAVVASLVGAVAVACLWVRGYWVADYWWCVRRPISAGFLSSRGSFQVGWRDWRRVRQPPSSESRHVTTPPMDFVGGFTRATYAGFGFSGHPFGWDLLFPAWLPFTLAMAPPIAWGMIRRSPAEPPGHEGERAD